MRTASDAGRHAQNMIDVQATICAIDQALKDEKEICLK